VYYDYFGLNQPPFRITPDTSLFFPGGNRGAILNAMIYAITSGEGIVKVVGEVGSGKTMLCRMLSVELPDNIEVVYIANPSLTPEHILHAIAIELKLAVNASDNRLRVMQSLQQYLLKRHSENCQVVLFIEEAQSMPINTLEEIRLLSNLETHQHKLLQIVLFGQPELDQMISRREIRQLKERITYSFCLNPLNHNEIRDYLNTRLRASGYRGNEIFTNSAIREIARFSKGLLRRINILADKSLLAAYAANQHEASAKLVRIAAKDSEFVAGWQHFRLAAVVAGVAIALILAAWLVPFNHLLESFNGWRASSTTTPEIEQVIAEQQKPAIGDQSEEIKSTETDPIETIYLPQHDTVYSDNLRVSEPPDQDVIETAETESVMGIETTADIEVSSPVPQTADNGSLESDVAMVSVDETGKLLADYLLDNDRYETLIGQGESLLSKDEVEILIEQFRIMPPESVYFSNADNACKLCTSIVYRPLIDIKNL
jgi:type II secretory pathway predicted ATPase ExeA